MLFQKLRIERLPDSDHPVENWYMILRSIDDVVKYMQLDANLHAQALLALPASITKSHLEGVRERMLHIKIQTSAMLLQEGEKIYPWELLKEFVDEKSRHMMKIILENGFVLVQSSGGYSDYKGYIDIWNAVVINELEKDDCYFPTDNAPTETDLLFIENSERIPVDFERQVDKIMNFKINDTTYYNTNRRWRPYAQFANESNAKKVFKLSQLKLHDPKFVAGMITKAKAIAFESALADKIQLDSMMQLFAKLEGKMVIIKTDYPDELKSHSLYDVCDKKHQIIFVNDNG